MKVEQVVICKADVLESDKMAGEPARDRPGNADGFKLPHRVLNICTGDMGAGKYKMYDIETWMPDRKNYGETHSDSNLNRLAGQKAERQIKTTDGKLKFVYTLNKYRNRQPRILIAILENYQQKDGSVVVPEILAALCRRGYY